MLRKTIPFLALLVPATASAQEINCPNDDVPIVNEVLNDLIGWSYLQYDFQTALDQFFYIRRGLNDGQISSPYTRSNKHALAVILAMTGVRGEAPDPVYDNGWVWPNMLGAGPFHRSKDEWGPFVHGKAARAYNTISVTGDVKRGKKFHHGHRSRAIERFTSPTAVARNKYSFNIDAEPNTVIDYSCRLFNKTEHTVDATGNWVTAVHGNDAAGFAETVVHEAWHSTGDGHTMSDPVPPFDHLCNEGFDRDGDLVPDPVDRCDPYVVANPGTHRGELAERKYGAYQAGFLFSCDLADYAADWVPMMVVLEADFDSFHQSYRDVFTNRQGMHDHVDASGNVDGPSTPYDCGFPGNRLRVEAVEGLGECSVSDAICRPGVIGDCGLGQSCDQPTGTQCDDGRTSCTSETDCAHLMGQFFCNALGCCEVVK